MVGTVVGTVVGTPGRCSEGREHEQRHSRGRDAHGCADSGTRVVATEDRRRPLSGLERAPIRNKSVRAPAVVLPARHAEGEGGHEEHP